MLVVYVSLLIMVTAPAVLSQTKLQQPTYAKSPNDFQKLTVNTSTHVIFLLLGTREPQTLYRETIQVCYWLIRYHMNIHPEFARVSIVTVADDTKTIVDSSLKIVNKCKVLDEIKHSAGDIDDSSTTRYDMLAGFKQVQSLCHKAISNRPSLKHVLFIATDGSFENDTHKKAVHMVRSSNFTGVFVIGLEKSSSFKRRRARKLASHVNHYVSLEEWKEIAMDVSRDGGLFSESAAWADHVTGCGRGCGENERCYCDGVTAAERCLCRPGYAPIYGNPGCEGCTESTYKDSPGEHPCLPCPPGVNTSEDKTSCLCDKINFPGCRDNCDGRSCGPREHCVSTGNTHNCSCKDGWGGSKCDLNFNDCINSTCSEGSNCIDAVNGHACLCDWSQDGFFCDMNFTFCIGRKSCKGRQGKREKEDEQEISSGPELLPYTPYLLGACSLLLFLAMVTFSLCMAWRMQRDLRGKREKIEANKRERRSPPVPPGYAVFIKSSKTGSVKRAEAEEKDMDAWRHYINALTEDSRIMNMYIASLDNEQYVASGSEFKLEAPVIAALYGVMCSGNVNLTINTGCHKLTILSNDRSVITGEVVVQAGEHEVNQVFSAAKSRDFITIATGDRETDEGQCHLEVTYLRDHFLHLEDPETYPQVAQNVVQESIKAEDAQLLYENEAHALEQNGVPAMNQNKGQTVNQNEITTVNQNEIPTVKQNEAHTLNQNEAQIVVQDEASALNQNDAKTFDHNEAPTMNLNEVQTRNQIDAHLVDKTY